MLQDNNYLSVYELSLEIISFQNYYFNSNESENTANVLNYLRFNIKYSLSNVLLQMETLFKIFLMLLIESANAKRDLSYEG